VEGGPRERKKKRDSSVIKFLGKEAEAKLQEGKSQREGRGQL